MVAFESMTSFARVHLCSRENAFHRETVEARVLSQRRTIPIAVAKQDNSECCRKTGRFRMLPQNRTIPSAVAKQDNSESEMVSYALPYIKAGIAVMA